MKKNLTKILSLVFLCFLLGNDVIAQDWVYADCPVVVIDPLSPEEAGAAAAAEIIAAGGTCAASARAAEEAARAAAIAAALAAGESAERASIEGSIAARAAVRAAVDVCGVAPPVAPAPVEPPPCISAANFCGATFIAPRSECGECPTNLDELFPPSTECDTKDPRSCPPCSSRDPLTDICTFDSSINECIFFPCDDGDPCTVGDVEQRNCDGTICVPCAGNLSEIQSIEVVNMRDCNDNGTANPSDDTFKGDILVTFNYTPVIEDFIITQDAYFSYRESFCIVNGNTITIEGRTFDADGERITLHGILNDRLTCSFTKNSLAGQALEPCSEGYFDSTESSLVANLTTTTPLATNSSSRIAATDMKVFPNPAQDELFVQFAGLDLTSAINVQIFDLSGRQQLVKEINTPTTLLPINISDLENGLYLVRLEQNGTVMMDRVVKSTK